MPRSNWKGVISFGLVSIPVSLVNSEDPTEKVLFHQIDKRNHARIKYQRINVETGKKVPWEDIIKGYEYNKDIILPVEEGELEKVAGENARTIAIENFVKKDSIDFVNVDKTYYLVPEKKGEKGYVILREALKESQTIGIAKVIISTKEYIAAVAHYENALVLYLLRYNEEIRPLSEFDIPEDNLKKYKANKKEVSAALLLIKSMTEKWNPKKYKDEYQKAVHQWAERKIKHKPSIIMQQRSESREYKPHVNFIELLRKSMGSARKAKRSKASVHHHLRKKNHVGRRTTVH